MNQKTYDKVYADCQAGGMNATDCDQIAREHAMTTTPNTNHTPGPWIALERYTNRQAVPIGRQRSALAHDIFAEAHGHNCEANARLIAAAPELYDACRRVLAWIEAHQDESFLHDHELSADCLRTAIAKAS